MIQRFISTSMGVLIPEAEAQKIGEDLLRRYGEDHRHYHNLAHISKMLAWLDRTGASSLAMELAVWFHDAVYEPLGGANEEKSAALFEREMGGFLDTDLTAQVVRLILATDFRRPRTGVADEALLIDIDFSILGSPWEEYDAYRKAVRREYAEVPEDKFIPGRAAVLRSFLSGSIFGTEFFAPLESVARSNIQRELTCLAVMAPAGPQ